MASFKGGIDYEFVSTPPKSLECSICLLTLRDPHVISCCGNHYCQLCIGRVKAAGKPCPLCNEPDYDIMLHKGVKREVNSLVVYCTQKALGCGWTGEVNQLNCHLNLGSRDSGCDYVELECSNRCGSSLLRKDIASHQDMECPNRPVERQFDVLAARLKQALADMQKLNGELTEKVNSVVGKNRQLEARCAATEERNGDLESKNASLEFALQDLKSKVETMESEKQTLKNRVSMLESLAKKVFHAEKKLASDSQRLDKLEQTVSKNKTQLEERCSLVEASLNLTPPFYFTLCNFEHYHAVSYQWQSTPFYTSSHGYKLSAVVYPHGISSGKGSHMSLYMAIMRGEYDDRLEWPFRGSVHVQIYNFVTQRWDSKAGVEFEANDDIKFTGRPQDCWANPGLGFPRWVALEEVVQKYCHKGMVRFRVGKVEVFSHLYMAVQ